ncbi:MAG: N-acyl-D-amino-acid deacylase family protein [Comamonas sp.]
MSSFDLVIRNGLVVDGSGEAPFAADIGIVGGKIAAVGAALPKGAQEIDATGMLVTPGFIDAHTHYDGHVTWENRLLPSSFHGITTAVIGNCGVGFAPCRAEQQDALINLMEGVEDIPFPVLKTGLPWTWESFPDYLDLLASRPYDMDVACYLPHAALRVYVMGERAVNREPATTADIERMCALFGEALDAGAVGIGTSRTLFHRSSDGNPIPTFEAAEAELLGLAETMRLRGHGVFQMVEDLHLPGASLALVTRLAERSNRPVTFTIGTANQGPQAWPRLVAELEAANDAGLTVKGQVLPRGIGMMLGHHLTLNPFYSTPSYVDIASTPWPERLEILRQPEVRTAILSEPLDANAPSVLGRMVRQFDAMFELGDPPNYEQPPERSIAARAARAGVAPEALAYDLLLQEGAMLYMALGNLTDGKLDAVGTLLKHRDIIPGLGDGGAHCGTICDASYSTFMLMHWGRDRAEGKLPIQDVVHRLSRAPAQLLGLLDRGLLAPGLKADINVIDLDNLYLHAPETTSDLPGGGRRLVQRSEGYAATIVSGQLVYVHGEATGALPGRLVRGSRQP